MGDRGNIVVLSTTYQGEREGVWLYSHWGGSRLEETARKAIERSMRIGDPTYLTREIFCAMIADGYHDSDDGKRGKEIFVREYAREEKDTGFFIEMLGEFLGDLNYGISAGGAGDQEHPTVVVDADTGAVWLDHNRPTETAEVCENPDKGGVV